MAICHQTTLSLPWSWGCGLGTRLPPTPFIYTYDKRKAFSLCSSLSILHAGPKSLQLHADNNQLATKSLPFQNQLKQSLEFFDRIWNNRWLRRVSIILFLNKDHSFKTKIEGGKKIEEYFPEFSTYTPPPDYLGKLCNNDLSRNLPLQCTFFCCLHACSQYVGSHTVRTD